MLEGKNVVLGVSGSIAAYKALYLVRLCVEHGASVWPMLTRGAERFVGPLSFAALTGRRPITDMWSASLAGEVSHVEWAHAAHVLVLAPATADLLNRLAAGRANDPLTAVALASDAPKIIAPAMESGMWNHPQTQASIETLRKRGALILSPTQGELASGRQGVGRMAEPEEILEGMRRALAPPSLQGKHVLVSAGPTREHIDPVRFVSNPSTGKMGFAIARAAYRHGAEVTLVSGPTSLPTPAGVERLNVESTQEMLQALQGRLEGTSVLIMAAAPSDYAPTEVSGVKVKKTESPTRMQIDMESTPDILSTLGARARGILTVGFAAETHNVDQYARDKIERKDLDLVVANDVSQPGVGFAGDTNAVVLHSRNGDSKKISLRSKDDVATAIVEQVVELFGEES